MAGPGVDLVQCVVDRSAVSVNEDVAVFTMHCRGMQAALPDDLFPLDDAGRTDFANKIQAFWGAIGTGIDTDHVLTAIKFYALPDTSGGNLGAPTKVVTVNVPGGAGSGQVPPQNALSVTFITDQRKTWGRFYLPGLAYNKLSSKRISSSWCDTVATAAHGLTARSGNGGCLTVWSRVHGTHHDPQFIQVDNVSDVIRSRRLSATTYRKKISAG